MKKYKPATKKELKKLVFTNNDIKLYDIDTSLITDMSELFHKSKRKDFEGIEDWDVSNVTNMEMMFAYMDYHLMGKYSMTDFNPNLNNWNVSKVKNMNNMFTYCSNFNQPLDKWDVSNVEDMAFMFFGAKEFNQDLNNWNTSKVKDMRGMFQHCEKFNEPLDKWDTSNVQDMSYMFAWAKEFNQPLNNWNISQVENLSNTFRYCHAFNQPLNDWDVSNVKNMESLFRECEKFNQPLDKWNTSNVETMENTFFSCRKFNQPLNSWNVSKVENMDCLFYLAKEFNQPLDKWDTQKVTTIAGLFRFAVVFNHYESLENWNLDSLENIGTFCDDYERLGLRLKIYVKAFYGSDEDCITITNNNAKEIYNSILKDKNKKVVRLRKKIETNFREELSLSEYNFTNIEDAENYIKNNYKEDKRLKFIKECHVLIKDKSREVNIKVIKYIYSEYLSLRNIIRLKRIDDIVNLLDKNSFIQQIKEFYLENRGDAACLIYGIYGGDEALKDIYELKFDSMFFLSLIKLNIEKKYALKLLYEIYTTTKKSDVKKEAFKIIDEVLEKMNISYSEFKLKSLPDFEFNSKGERELNKDYKLILNNDYSLSLFNIKNSKTLKNMPNKFDEELKEEIKSIEKEINKFMRANSYLLSIILIDGEMYSYDLFREYFIDNVLMNKFASTLIWNLYDKDKNIITTFRYLGESKYLDSENKEIKIDNDSFVGLASPVEMSDETIDKWIKQLECYKLSQPLEQLKVVKLDKKNLQKEIKKFSSIEGTYGAFRDFAKRYEMHTNDKFGETITYTFTSNDDDIFSMTADIDENTEYDDIIKINISFGNKNYKQTSSRFIYSFLVFIICGFKLSDLL